MATGDGLCYECTSDPYLSEKIRKNGSRLKCVGCGKRWRRCIPIEELGADIREILEKHYGKCESPDDGDDLNWIVQEIASLEGPEVADRILEHVLPDAGERYVAAKDGADLFLEEDATYEARPSYAGEFRYTWNSFRFNVKHSARFFSTTAESRLQELLDGIERFKTQDKKCIRTIALGEPDSTVFRARKVLNASVLAEVLDDPASALGPPPGRLASAGRMNPTGVSVFYGSFDAKTCVAEIRLPVGGMAVTASFRLVRPITVLDLTVLDQGTHGVSMFDPMFDHVSEQSAFLEGFHDEISRPVLEHEAELEFIPTQVVAEYLSQKFKPPLDGLIYKSTQTGGQGLNIVLFHHASGLKKTKASAERPESKPEMGIDEDQGEVVIYNPRPLHDRDQKGDRASSVEFFDTDLEVEISDPSAHPDVTVSPTLELVDGSLQFWRLRAAQQDLESLMISDRRKEDEEPTKASPSDLPNDPS